MRGLIAVLLTLLLGIPASAQAPPGPPPRNYPDRIVAIVEGIPITFFQLDLECRILRDEYSTLTPGSKARRKIQSEVLEKILEKEVLVQKAAAEKLKLEEKDEKRLKWELARQAQDNGGEENFQRKLKSMGIPRDYWIQRQRRSLIVNKLVVKNVSRDIFISPSEIRRYYELNKGKYRRPGVTRLRQIVIYPDPEDATRDPLPPAVKQRTEGKETWDHRAYAEEVRARLLKGEPFAEVCKQCTMDSRNQLVPESSRPLTETLEPPLGEHVQGLRPGEITEIIETDRGKLYIIQLVDRRLPGHLPFEEVQKDIEMVLKEVVWGRRLDAWIGGIKSRAMILRFLPDSK